MKHYFVYWAPEVINDEQISKKSDIWALGVLIFLLLTGEYPFDLRNEDQALNNITKGNVNWRLLNNYQKIQEMMRALLNPDPVKRWNADKVLEYCQEDFAIIIQRFWRGAMERIKFRKLCHALIKLQAMIKGWFVRRKYRRRRLELRWQSALLIQRKFKKYKL